MKDLNDLQLKVLDLLKEDARRTPALLSTLLGESEDKIKNAVAQLDKTTSS